MYMLCIYECKTIHLLFSGHVICEERWKVNCYCDVFLLRVTFCRSICTFAAKFDSSFV